MASLIPEGVAYGTFYLLVFVYKIMPTPLISKTECHVTPEIEAKIKAFSPQALKSLKENEKHVNVFRITYRSRGLIIAGFLVEPKVKGGAKLPCIIWNRGGSRDFGGLVIGQCFRALGSLARQGYIVIASQYSGGPGSEGVDDMGGDNIEDVLILRKILQKWPHADAANIGMYGGSRGGLMTYRALSMVSWIKAAVIAFAPTDEVAAPKFRKGWREHQISMYGHSKKEQIRRSALYWPEKICKKTPILIMHGSADWRVQAHDSIRMADKLYEQKVPFRLVIYEGADHGLTEVKEESTQLMDQWFKRFLKNKEKLPNLKLHGN